MKLLQVCTFECIVVPKPAGRIEAKGYQAVWNGANPPKPPTFSVRVEMFNNKLSRNIALSPNELRDKFSSFFGSDISLNISTSHGLKCFSGKVQHKEADSSPLVPPSQDKSIMFVNSGMVQFKEYFEGRRTPQYPNRFSIQRCIRAGGKHNDLNNVGFTARHHTMFEMLGNFSFGSAKSGNYSKLEAIHIAFRFLVKELQMPFENLLFTVDEKDAESYSIWSELIANYSTCKQKGIEAKFFEGSFDAKGTDYNHKNIAKQLFRIKTGKDNWWSVGETGLCGYCTEIYYAKEQGLSIPENGVQEEESDKIIEIWNIVCMEFNKKSNGELISLESKSIDTGAGFERLLAVLNGNSNNFDTQLFMPIVQEIQKVYTGASGAVNPSTNQNIQNYRVIADHMRAISFLIADGVLPGPAEAGYVLRKIIRRACSFAAAIRQQPEATSNNEPKLHKLVNVVIENANPKWQGLLSNAKERIVRTLIQEEENYNKIAQNADLHMRREFNILRALVRATINGNKDIKELINRFAMEGQSAFEAKQDKYMLEEVKRAYYMDAYSSANSLWEKGKKLEEGTNSNTEEGFKKEDLIIIGCAKGATEIVIRYVCEKLKDTYGIGVAEIESWVVREIGADGLGIIEKSQEQVSGELIHFYLQPPVNKGKNAEEFVFELFHEIRAQSKTAELFRRESPKQYSCKAKCLGLARKDEGGLSTHKYYGIGAHLIDTYQSDCRKPIDHFRKGIPEEVGKVNITTGDWLVFNETVFYPEGGGQMGDVGVIELPPLQGVEYQSDNANNPLFQALNDEGEPVEINPANSYKEAIINGTPQIKEKGLIVTDTKYLRKGEFPIIGHKVKVPEELEGRIKLKQLVGVNELKKVPDCTLKVNVGLRHGSTIHHSATHLLNKVLRDKFGSGVMQKGSQLYPYSLRFDFTHNKQITEEEVISIECEVNSLILENAPIRCFELRMEDANNAGVVCMPNETYGEAVRVVQIGTAKGGKYRELCGGTHVNQTGDIGLFKITGTRSVGAGARRVEATAGLSAYEYVTKIQQELLAVKEKYLVGVNQPAESERKQEAGSEGGMFMKRLSSAKEVGDNPILDYIQKLHIKGRLAQEEFSTQLLNIISKELKQAKRYTLPADQSLVSTSTQEENKQKTIIGAKVSIPISNMEILKGIGGGMLSIIPGDLDVVFLEAGDTERYLCIYRNKLKGKNAHSNNQDAKLNNIMYIKALQKEVFKEAGVKITEGQASAMNFIIKIGAKVGELGKGDGKERG